MKKLLIALLLVLFSVQLHAKSTKKPKDKITEYDIAIEYAVLDCRAIVAEHAEDNAAVLKMFDETTALWQKQYVKSKGQFPIQALLDGVAFSARKHEGQYRKDAAHTPYIVHPIGVSRILWEEGNVRSTNVLVAALLHDTLEDTDATTEEVEMKFGARVRETVQELTNDATLTTEQNKQRQVNHAPQMSLNAQLVKLADRIYNIRDLQNPPADWSQEKIDGYYQWGAKLLEALRGTNEGLEKALQKEIEQHAKSKE